MLHRKRRVIKFKKFKIILFTVLIIFISTIIFCETTLSNFRPYYIRIRAEVLSSNTVCSTVENALDKLNYSYDDIARISYSQSGVVQSITTDSIKINKIKSYITRMVQKEISKLYDNQIKIPLGAFTNITVLSNCGPEISVNFTLTGSFSSELISTFEQAGINQTIHHIKLLLTSKIMTTTLDYSGSITYVTDFEIAQAVIVGAIPSTYGSLYKTY